METTIYFLSSGLLQLFQKPWLWTSFKNSMKPLGFRQQGTSPRAHGKDLAMLYALLTDIAWSLGT